MSIEVVRGEGCEKRRSKSGEEERARREGVRVEKECGWRRSE